MTAFDKMTALERIKQINRWVLHDPLPKVDPAAPMLPGIVERARRLGVSWGEVMKGQTPRAMMQSAAGRAGGQAAHALHDAWKDGVELSADKEAAAERLHDGFVRGGKVGGQAAHALHDAWKDGVELSADKEAAAERLHDGLVRGAQEINELLSDWREGVELSADKKAAAERIYDGRVQGGRNMQNEEVIDPRTGKKVKRAAVTASAQAGKRRTSGKYTTRFQAEIEWEEQNTKGEWVKAGPVWRSASPNTADIGTGSALGGFRLNNSFTFQKAKETGMVRDVKIRRTAPLIKRPAPLVKKAQR